MTRSQKVLLAIVFALASLLLSLAPAFSLADKFIGENPHLLGWVVDLGFPMTIWFFLRASWWVWLATICLIGVGEFFIWRK